jgi:hypothetical protein
VHEPSDPDRLDEEALAELLPGSMALRVARRGCPRPRREACVSMSGTTRQIAIILMVLEAGAGSGQYEITSRSGPYAAGQAPGGRVDITLRFPDNDPRRGGPGAGASASTS